MAGCPPLRPRYRQVLNKARQAVPTSAEVWITGGLSALGCQGLDG